MPTGPCSPSGIHNATITYPVSDEIEKLKARLALYEARDKFTTQEDTMGGIRIIRKDPQGNILSSMWFSQETWSKLKL